MAVFEAPRNALRRTAWLACLACVSSFAYASSSIVDCDEDRDALRVDAVDEISAESASHDSELAPRVEAAESRVRAALPGVSEHDQQDYRREMYRTDI